MSELRDIRVTWTRPGGGEDAGGWEAALVAWSRDMHASGEGRVLKKDRPDDPQHIDGVYRATVQAVGTADDQNNSDEREVVIKCRVLRSWSDRLKAAVGAGRATRHRRGAAWLEKRGMDTAPVLAQARGVVHDDPRPGKSVPVELLVMEFVEGPTLLEVMAAVARRDAHAPSVREQHEIARAVGQQIVRFMPHGYNRDHKPSNLIVQRRGTLWRIVVLDAVAIRRGVAKALLLPRDARGKWGGAPGGGMAVFAGAIKMLSSLVIEPTGCGCRPRKTLMMRVVRTMLERLGTDNSRGFMRRHVRRQFWKLTSRIVTRHRDPKPRVNPLGDALRQ